MRQWSLKHQRFAATISALAVFALSSAFTQVVRADVHASSASDPDVFYSFDGNTIDAANGSSIIFPATCPATTNNVCNASTSFGTDAKGGYWAWTANRGRGGGFSIETNSSMGTTFSIALRMSIAETNCYRTLIDFTNGVSDDHLYFCDGMQLYPLPTSTFTFTPNVVYDLLLSRTSAGHFVAYVLDSNGTPIQIIDQADTSIMIPFATASGGSRLNFFHDECCEYSTGGKVYDLRIWENRIVSPGDFTPVPQPAAPVNNVLPSISGSAVAQQSISASTGTWTGNPTPTYSYKWKRAASVGGTYSDIPSATNSTYMLGDSDVGQFIKVEVTATNSLGSVSVLSAATSAISAAPTTTTSTTIPRTTTVPPALIIDIQAPSTTQVGQASIATIAPSSKTSTPNVAPGSTTTVPLVATTVSTTVPAPIAPIPAQVSTGQAVVQVKGVAADSTVTRENNQIIVTTGSVKATFAGVNSKGTVSALDANGGISLAPGSRIRIRAAGFQANSKVDAWIFSSPILLGTSVTDASGGLDMSFVVPSQIGVGSHRVSVVAKLADGKPVEFTVGIGVLGASKKIRVAPWLIATPILVAIFSAFFLPPALKRRRRSPNDAIT